MSIKIHHGPPGSYKTSGAIADDLKAAVLSGRHIITNVRGLSDKELIARVIEEESSKGIGFLKPEKKTIPESFNLTYIKTDPTDTDFPEESCSENMEMLRRFWHWSPNGAFFILDEVQEIWPKSYRETHLKKLEYPGGIEAANADERFLDIALAFEKHRHKNWDFIVTTPNINKVHPVVRGAAEGAYKHKNLAMLGELFKGRYIEGFHAADTNGKPSDFYSVTRKKVPKYVFSLYKSTATGIVQDTTAGQSLFRNPKILGLGLMVLALIAYLASSGLPRMFSSPHQQVDAHTAAAPAAPDRGRSVAPASASGAVPGATVPGAQVAALPSRLSFMNQVDSIDVLAAYTEIIGKNAISRFVLRFQLPNGRHFDVSDKNFSRLGIIVSVLDTCMYEIRAKDTIQYAYCSDLPTLADATQTNTGQGAPVDNASISQPEPLLPVTN